MKKIVVLLLSLLCLFSFFSNEAFYAEENVSSTAKVSFTKNHITGEKITLANIQNPIGNINGIANERKISKILPRTGDESDQWHKYLSFLGLELLIIVIGLWRESIATVVKDGILNGK
ncbi:hypothetical protein JZO73_03005 [Enterococcus plantarum]|uniref:hypothetical protein n=1 Tax=Enterococcus plantarum TaxID=1077675 RepID=UPI001A8C485E|nr:hypothetical protein [Enterococcus plantarum]MBO0466497.1 hypothetical protein [Enterococcus plantarum]